MSLVRILPYRLPRFSGLCLFVTAYIGLFFIAGTILFGSLFRNRSSNPIITTDSCAISKNKASHRCLEYYTFSPLNTLLHSPVAEQIRNYYIVNEKKFNIFSRSSTDLNLSHEHSKLMNCTSLYEVSNIEYIAGGWTKNVYKAIFRGQKIAIKTARLNGHDVQECQKKQGGSLATCFQSVGAKIIKEIILLSELAHENVIKILGFCIPDGDGSAMLITELGEPMDIMHLLQISWEDRLLLVLGIARILFHFAHSPLGSLSMNDFRREQFVIVDGILKITDLDDVGIGEPECANDNECQNISNFIFKGNGTRRDFTPRASQCFDFHCVGYNSRMNIWHAGQHFVKLLLPIGAPTSLQPYIEELLAIYEFRKPEMEGDVSQILDATQWIVNHYKSGKYFNSSGEPKKLGFRKIDDSDLPGMFDYRCRYSISAVSCVMSVFNEEEAAQFCSQDSSCKAVVLSKQQTWTGEEKPDLIIFYVFYASYEYFLIGRTIAIFKNGFDAPVERKGFILLQKL